MLEGSPILGIRHAALPALDLERAVRFYCENLGFRIYHAGDPDWAMVSLGPTTLSLIRVTAPIQRSEGGSHPAHLGINAQSPEAVTSLYMKLNASGIARIDPPKTHRDGSYGFYFRDSEGNQLELIFIPEAGFREVGDRIRDEATVMVAHGSPEAEMYEPFARLLRDFHLHAPKLRSELAFLKFGEPKLVDVIASLMREKAWKRISLLPVFLASGLEVRRVLPELAKGFERAYPGTQFRVTAPLGDSAWVRAGMISAALEAAQS